jgi:NAD(P)-dependent dehydrogenase (short-subunit alcohol dehydrogenase family)
MTISLITGANKGLGHETARQLIELGHTVYVGARSVQRGEAAATELGARFVQLDVTDDASVAAALAAIDQAKATLTYWLTTPASAPERMSMARSHSRYSTPMRSA